MKPDRARQEQVEPEPSGVPGGTGELSPVPLEVTDILDLHSFAVSEVAAVVEVYLEEALRKGFTTVRLIHGKGIGVQRERVRALLSRTPFVADFQDAPMEAGGWGATIVWFRPEMIPGERK